MNPGPYRYDEDLVVAAGALPNSYDQSSLGDLCLDRILLEDQPVP